MKVNETINILCATDDNYAPYCGIMLTSLFESNRNRSIEVWVLMDGDITNRNRLKFEKLQQKYSNEIHLVEVDDERLKDLLNRLNNGETQIYHTYVTTPSYYRLLAADLLPETVHKIIYMDCDIAVDGDITPLWNVDLSDKAIACVRDCYVLDKETDKRLGYPKGKGYFNAGVVVFNLDYWRKERMTERIFEYVRGRANQLKYLDQDILNGVLWDEKLFVPERFNFQVVYFAPYFWQDYPDDFRRDLLEECRKAVVIHYCCILKVWDFRYYGGPFYSVWEKYRKMSLWSNAHITKPLKTYVWFMMKRWLFPKKLKKQRQGNWVVLTENETCF